MHTLFDNSTPIRMVAGTHEDGRSGNSHSLAQSHLQANSIFETKGRQHAPKETQLYARAYTQPHGHPQPHPQLHTQQIKKISTRLFLLLYHGQLQALLY